MLQSGLLGTEAVPIGEREVRVGDRIVCRRMTHDSGSATAFAARSSASIE
jgi:hypothetical protein